jgi:hypothetical protein
MRAPDGGLQGIGSWSRAAGSAVSRSAQPRRGLAAGERAAPFSIFSEHSERAASRAALTAFSRMGAVRLPEVPEPLDQGG